MQQSEATRRGQQKTNAGHAIRGLSKKQDQQKSLSKQLAKARMDLEWLQIDEKHVRLQQQTHLYVLPCRPILCHKEAKIPCASCQQHIEPNSRRQQH